MFHATKSKARVVLYVDLGDKDENEKIYDELFKSKEQIEKDFGGRLIWERQDNNIYCRVKLENPGNVSDKDLWDKMIEFMTNNMVKLDNAFEDHIAKLKVKYSR